MKLNYCLLAASILFAGSWSCQNPESAPAATATATAPEKGTYAYDVSFLKKYLSNTLELHDDAGRSRVLISPEYQGRVMTSTAGGDSGSSFGWMNYHLIATQQFKAHFNPVGGEERFWLGPEGGQYAIYFSKGDSFNLNHWQVPPVLDTLPYHLDSADAVHAVFSKKAVLTNYSGTAFNVAIRRSIHLLDRPQVAGALAVDIPTGLESVAFETINQITNTGASAWKKETGLLSIWLLGMMTPTPQTVVIIPFKPGKDSRKLITDNYFGTIPADRLVVKDSVLFFKCDGKMRSKIGLSPLIANSLAASFDFSKNVLTIIHFPVDRTGRYVNSKWEIQKNPYSGDVINSYNDGPLADGSQLGPFYEIESSSAAQELQPGATQEHREVTAHFHGDYDTLREFARKLLGVDLDELKKM